MRGWLLAFLWTWLFASGIAIAQDRKAVPAVPDQFLIGRRTFFDFGPPFDYFEILSVRSSDAGASIDRITLTPAGSRCTQPATVEVAPATSTTQSVADLLGKSNPCAIPDKDVRRERKRCKKCLVFSGAEVTMQVACNGQSRRIRMDILDRDLFDPNARTPQHTSWTMGLMARIDGLVGDTVMDRPAFSLIGTPPSVAIPPSTPLVQLLKEGGFDQLFEGETLKPSKIYEDALTPLPTPTVELVNSSPFRPLSYGLPPYPALARVANVSGTVSFRVEITPAGEVASLRFDEGSKLLQPIVEEAVKSWRFPAEAAGQEIRASIVFQTNCQIANR